MAETECGSCGRLILSSEDAYAVCPDAVKGFAADNRVFFAAAGPDGVEPGDRERTALEPMLYCEKCANLLFANDTWRDARPLRIDIPEADLKGSDGKEARREVINFSVALRARRAGVGVSRARQEARSLGRLWWVDRPAATSQLREGTEERRNRIREQESHLNNRIVKWSTAIGALTLMIVLGVASEHQQQLRDQEFIRTVGGLPATNGWDSVATGLSWGKFAGGGAIFGGMIGFIVVWARTLMKKLFGAG